MKRNSRKLTDLNKILKPFENQCVALSPDKKRVVSHGDTLREAVLGVKEEERGIVSFMRVLPLDINYVPLQG
ncbi:hypothetical protein MYX76_13470 [Desulfobacterota bacterium AH_259_B03_O07]|nr:hypothetical protein [Desulfobacterota bacterium AH_259_B03_O07]